MKNNDFFKKMTQEGYENIINARKLIEEEKKRIALFMVELNSLGLNDIIKDAKELKKALDCLDRKLKEYEL